jgi:hypothetical protein
MDHLHRTFGRAHAAVAWRVSRASPRTAPAAAAAQRGQGTVEYVALMLLVATILTAVVAASGKVGDGGIAKIIVAKLKDAIEGVTSR